MSINHSRNDIHYLREDFLFELRKYREKNLYEECLRY